MCVCNKKSLLHNMEYIIRLPLSGHGNSTHLTLVSLAAVHTVQLSTDARFSLVCSVMCMP